ncbi:MAG: DUF484 family protein [Burkholderiales bacterium]|nr:DUF484 family protein [Burkholderiales bacterium]
MRLTAEDVAQFLKDHPEFFDQYAEQLAEIYVPHPHGGRAIPIAERQIVTLREKNRALEDKLAELVQFGQENDVIIERMHRITLALMISRDLDGLLASLYYNLREDFAVPHVALRLWADGGWERPEFGDVSQEVRVFTESLTNPYCATHPMFETAGWFGDDGVGLQSFAYVALRAEQPFGLLGLGSEDPQRFYPEMGTLYLKRLGEQISMALSRFLRPG